MIKALRKLARSHKYQLLYNRAKEISNIRLFKNNTDFTSIQLLFLHWLEVYSVMYLDLATNKNMLNEEIINDDLRAEAYLIWKNHNRKNKDKSKNTRKVVSGLPGINFKSGK